MSEVRRFWERGGRKWPGPARRVEARGLAFGVVAAAALACTSTGPRPEPAQAAANRQQAPASGTRGPGVPAFWVRPGFHVSLAATNLEEARFIEVGPNGWLYLSRPNHGDILSLRAKDRVYERVASFVSNRPTVHGLCFRDGWLWFATSRGIFRGRDTNGDGRADEVVTVLPEGSLPGGTGHWWRALLVTDRHLFTSVGDPGNITDQTATDRCKIWRYNLDGSGKTLWSSGIRNTEKLRIRPGTQEVWGSDHGSDWYGAPIGDRQGKQPITDLQPPEEFNKYVQGGFYGHPFIVGFGLPRVEFYNRSDIIELAEKAIAPEWGLPAHWAVNGWCFVDSDGLGAELRGDAIMAAHGSWNSSKPVGYCIERILFDKATGKPYGNQSLVVCMQGGKPLDRPVDCAMAPDGSLLFSCDETNSIYRLSRVTK